MTSGPSVAIVVASGFAAEVRRIAEHRHVWAIRTAEYQRVADDHRRRWPGHSLERGTTLFAGGEKAPEERLIAIFGTVEEHHGEYSHVPPLDEVEVLGADPTAAVRSVLTDHGFTVISEFDRGFVARRLVALIRHEFGPEGLAYVRAYLESNIEWGKRLGRMVLDAQAIEAGSVWAYVPEGREDAARDFERGLATADEWRNGRTALVGEYLEDQLQRAGDRGVLVSEDVYAKRSDQWLARFPDKAVVFCGNDVYEFADKDRPRDEIASLAYGAASWDPAVAVVGRLPTDVPGLANRATVEATTLRHLAATARVIAVGAWDEESALFWEPGRSA